MVVVVVRMWRNIWIGSLFPCLFAVATDLKMELSFLLSFFLSSLVGKRQKGLGRIGPGRSFPPPAKVLSVPLIVE